MYPTWASPCAWAQPPAEHRLRRTDRRGPRHIRCIVRLERRMLIRLLILSVSLGLVYAGEPDNKTLNEISHLLSFISSAPCQFHRNGKWYDSPDARAHIERKYDFVLAKGMIHSTEDFIEYAASKSSMSGTNYMVKCGDGDPIPSSNWLKKELSTYRAKAK